MIVGPATGLIAFFVSMYMRRFAVRDHPTDDPRDQRDPTGLSVFFVSV